MCNVCRLKVFSDCDWPVELAHEVLEILEGKNAIQVDKDFHMALGICPFEFHEEIYGSSEKEESFCLYWNSRHGRKRLKRTIPRRLLK